MRIPFASIEVNPLTRKEVKALQVDGGKYSKVPVAVFPDGEKVKESSMIIERAANSLPQDGGDGASPRIDKEHFFSADAKRWHDWVDKELAVGLYPNITRNMSESWTALGYVHKEFPNPLMAYSIRGLGAFGMSMAHGKIIKKYNIEASKEREYLWTKVEQWETAVGDQKFRGGDAAPDVSDVAVFGCVNGLKELPLHTELMARPAFRAWYERMEQEVLVE